MATTIKLSERAYQDWYDKLLEFFKSKDIPIRDAILKVKGILNEAQKGWPRAPKDIETRIKMKSGYQWKSHENLKSHTESLPNVIESDEKRSDTVRELFQWEKSLKPAERLWWERRESQYRSEFEFNTSSDEPMLFQLLVEELTQQRLAAITLKDPKSADAYSKLMTDSLRRLQEVQTKLGITREQRSDILDNADGDISSLSVDYEEKVRRARLQIQEWLKEERKHIHIKKTDGIMNSLPPFEKIEALLGMDPDGNLGGNLDTMEISKVLEEATKIHDETLEEVQKEKNVSTDETKTQGSINEIRTDEAN